KIDKVITNRILGLPIFAAVMFAIYWIAMVGVGAPATDWANDGLFGDGFHLIGIGDGEAEEAADAYTQALNAVDAYMGIDTEDEEFDADAMLADMKAFTSDEKMVSYTVEDEETLEESEINVYFDDASMPEEPDEEADELNSHITIAVVEYDIHSRKREASKVRKLLEDEFR
ncbi:MAG: hypothetical protein J5628_08775, partial [Lachnospiraceae bacterium]|nr:hypothetical protein [Lachnospiraceae bacterium]